MTANASPIGLTHETMTFFRVLPITRNCDIVLARGAKLTDSSFFPDLSNASAIGIAYKRSYVSYTGPSDFWKAFTAGRRALNTRRIFSCSIVNAGAPIRARAALMLLSEPVKVSLAAVACSPKAEFIASAKSAKETWPLDTMSRSSASVMSANLPVAL